MSEHDELSGTTPGGKLGCVAGSIVGLPILSVLSFLAFSGHCGPDDPCQRGLGLRELIVISLTLAVAVPVGLVVRKIVNRRVDRR